MLPPILVCSIAMAVRIVILIAFVRHVTFMGVDITTAWFVYLLL